MLFQTRAVRAHPARLSDIFIARIYMFNSVWGRATTLLSLSLCQSWFPIMCESEFGTFMLSQNPVQSSALYSSLSLYSGLAQTRLMSSKALRSSHPRSSNHLGLWGRAVHSVAFKWTQEGLSGHPVNVHESMCICMP